MTSAPGAEAALRVRGAWKAYDEQPVLRDVDLTVAPGEIHALLGANGAGKSTLIRIVAGVVARDAGEVAIAGRDMPRRFLAADAARAGLAVVHQDVGLVDDLSVAENVALRLGYATRHRLISHRRTQAAARRALDAVAADIAVNRPVSDLAHAQRVMVALACVLATRARVVVLDEISASVPAPEVARIAAMVRRLRDEGVGVLFVTHRLAEVFQLADRVTVLRDGRRVGAAAIGEIDEAALLDWIAGAAVATVPAPPAVVAAGTPRLAVRGLDCDGLAAPVSFDVAAGEVLALTGLVGSGSHAVTRALGGAEPPTAGAMFLDGDPVAAGEPAALLGAGCAYLPADRQRTGIAPLLSVRENLFLARNRRAGDRVVTRPRSERSRAVALADRVGVRVAAGHGADAVEAPIATLSGGNQQKVLVGRAVRGAPRAMILEDATAGVDVSARADLLRLVLEMAERGTAVLLASSDHQEIAQVAGRAIVFADGRVVAELPRARIHEEEIARASFGYAPEIENRSGGRPG